MQQALTDAERQQAYRARLDAVGKTVVRLVIRKEDALRIRRMARGDVTRQSAIIAKALDALAAIQEAGTLETSA